VYAIILPKDDNGVLPESVSLPAQLAANRGPVTLLGYGALAYGETKGGEVVVAIPSAARTNPPCAHAWAIKIAPK
jgi:hypothetical protein